MKRIVLSVVLVQCRLLATTATWINTTGSTSMNVPTHWSTGTVPTNGTVLNFPPGPTGIQFTVSNDIGPFTLAPSVASSNSLTITNDGTTTYTLTPSLPGNVFTVPSAATALITFGSAGGSLANILAIPLALNTGTLNLIGGSGFDHVTGGITGTGTLQVTGGAVQISGSSNTYTGPTNVNSGTLQLGSNDTLPTGTAFTAASAGIFDLNNFNQTLTAATISGTAQTGTGTLSVSSLSGTGTITINTSGTLKVTNSGTNTFAGTLITGLSGAGGTFELGAGSTGTFTLSGANAYSTQTAIGFTTVTAGTLQAGNASAFGTKSNLSIASGATLNLNGNTSLFNTLSGAGSLQLGTANITISSGNSNTFSGQITGTSNSQFNYAGSDLLILSGTTNSIPTIAISGGGTLRVASLTNINSVLFQTTTNGTLQFSTGVTASTPMTLSSANANLDTVANSVALSGNISGGGSLTKVGSGTLTLSGTGNAYTGGTIVSAGVMQISSSSAFPPSGTTGTPLSISGGATFGMQNNAITISTLSGAGTLSMGSAAATVTVGGTTFSGDITGSGGFVYSGNGTTLTLSGTNGYTGTTTINGQGTLAVAQSAFNTTTGLIFSGAGGTLQATNPLTNSIPITLTTNGTINTNGQACTFSGKISGSGAFTKQGTGTLIINSATSDYTGQTNVFQGTLQAGSAAAFGATTALNIKGGAILNLNSQSISVTQLLGDTGSSLQLGSGTLTITGGVSTNPFYGVISGTGNLILHGGEPSFLGTSTYTGTTTVQNNASYNTLNLGSTSNVTFGTGGGILTIGSTAASASTATFTLNNDATISTNTFNLELQGVITGSSNTFKKLGQGTLYLNPGSANSFASTPLSIQGGTLKVTANGLGTPASITFQNFCGTLQAAGPLTITSPVTVSSIGTIDTNGNTVTISANISPPAASTGLPSGGLTKDGTGTLFLTGTNTYTAPTTISNGTLNAGTSSLPLPTMAFTPTLIFSGSGSGIFQATTGNTFTSFPTVILNKSGTINTNGNNMTLNNVVAGESTSTFTKAGTGTMTMTAANLYTGPTVVSGGTLAAGIASATTPTASGAFGVGSNITVNFGTTLDFNTFANSIGTLANSGTVSSKATVAATSYTQMSSLILDVATSDASIFGNITTTGAINLAGDLQLTNSGGYMPLAGDSLVILESSGSGKQVNGTFASVTEIPSNTFGPYILSADYKNNQVLLLFSGSSGCSGNWISTSSQNWGNASNWQGSCVPGISASGPYANFNDFGSAQGTVTLATSSGTIALNVSLAKLTFDASSTNYTIQQFSGAGNITLSGINAFPSPHIDVLAGTHTINAPIILSGTAPAFISLDAGTLTLGANCTITSSSTAQLDIVEGAGGAATLINNGQITPNSLLVEGNTLQNAGQIAATTTVVLAGLQGNATPLIVTNNATKSITAGTSFTIGGANAATTTVNNSGTMSSGTNFSILSGTVNNSGIMSATANVSIAGGTVTNQSGGQLFASGSTFAISGGSVTNSQGGALGSNNADLVYSGGTLSASDQVLGKSYTQGASNTITLNFPQNAASPVGRVTTTGAITLTGTLNVTDVGGFMPITPTEIVLFQSSGSGKQLTGAFTTVNPLPFGTLKYDYSENKVILSGGTSVCDGIWAAASNGNWAASGNWSGCVPGIGVSTTDTATFPTVGASSVIVTLANSGGTLAQNVTLHHLTFNSASTSYTIQRFSGSGTITLDGTVSSKPQIVVTAGTHTINAPIVLNQDVRFTLSSGGLTLGPASSITSVGNTWNLSEGVGSGVLTNQGTIAPLHLLIEGNTLNNSGTISPVGTFSLIGLGSISTPVLLNNSATLSSGGVFTVGGGTGPTILNNAGTMTSGSTLIIGGGAGATTLNNTGTITAAASVTINSGTVTNNSGSTLAPGSGSTFTMAGGILANNLGGTVGASTANFSFSGGSIVTLGQILANNYTQSSGTTLQTNVSSLSAFGQIAASNTAALGGNLIVFAQPDISLVDGNTVNLITSAAELTTQFANVAFQNFPPSLIPSLIYLNHAVQLDLRGTNPTPTHGSSSSAIFNSIYQHNTLLTLQMMHMRDRMNTSSAGTTTASRALSDFADELLAENAEIAQRSRPGIVQKPAQLSQRAAAQGSPWNVYAGPVSSFGHVKDKGAQLGLGYLSVGGLAGFDKVLKDTENSVSYAGVGAVVEYRKIWSNVNNHGGSSSTDRVHGSFYATALPKVLPNLAIEMIFGFAFNWDDLLRNNIGPQQLTTHATTTETIGDALIGFEYSFSGKQYHALPRNFTIVPLVTLQYVIDRVGEYTESGAGIYDIRVNAYTAQSLTSQLGSRFQYLFQSNSSSLRIELDAGWQREYLNRSLLITATPFNITTASAATPTVAPGRNSLILALDLLETFKGGWQLEANSTYQQNSLYYDLFFYLGFGREF